MMEKWRIGVLRTGSASGVHEAADASEGKITDLLHEGGNVLIMSCPTFNYRLSFYK
jgi:hypothetical protein